MFLYYLSSHEFDILQDIESSKSYSQVNGSSKIQDIYSSINSGNENDETSHLLVSSQQQRFRGKRDWKDVVLKYVV